DFVQDIESFEPQLELRSLVKRKDPAQSSINPKNPRSVVSITTNRRVCVNISSCRIDNNRCRAAGGVSKSCRIKYLVADVGAAFAAAHPVIHINFLSRNKFRPITNALSIRFVAIEQ